MHNACSWVLVIGSDVRYKACEREWGEWSGLMD